MGDVEFASQFHRLVDELDRNGRRDTQIMLLLGSLAARLIREAGADNWTDLKLRISDRSLKEVVETLDAQAAGYVAEGRTKPAYVARLLGISLAAGRLADPDLLRRDQMLNSFIDAAADVVIEARKGRSTAGP